ncbi:MAG: ABC transporter ATP-binding protein [Oligoflexia bacterium]|nr:ABC transporter ATP-binding protein [Oligoflexia bacterium]
MMENILEIKDLKVEFEIEGKTLTAVDGVSLDIAKGKTTGIVGESGCGKSVTAFSVMRLIPNPPGRISSGEIIYGGRDIMKLPINDMQKIRGREISMIFQEPMTALNPVYTVGDQIAEIYELHYELSKAEIKNRTIEMLHKVGIPSPEKRVNDYPHQMSGGMRQRIMIAMALACSPKILIADEPTTALDVTIQAQILELISDLKKYFNTSVIFITHDLGVVAQVCDEVAVMYAGKIVERANVMDLFENPRHPYTKGLMDSIPKKGFSKDRKLPTIDGMVPDLFNQQKGCRFAERCFKCQELCKTKEPELVKTDNNREYACHYPL